VPEPPADAVVRGTDVASGSFRERLPLRLAARLAGKAAGRYLRDVGGLARWARLGHWGPRNLAMPGSWLAGKPVIPSSKAIAAGAACRPRRSGAGGLARSPAPGWCLLPCLPAAAGHPGSEGFQGLRRAPRVAAARAIACGRLAHRGGGQRGRGARSRRDSSRACPAARTRERLPGRVPSHVAAACRGWRHGLPPPRVIGTSPGWRADPRSAGWAGRWLPPAARVTSPAVPPSLLTADQPGSGVRVIRGNFGLTADAGGTHGPGSGHYLLCPGTHQGIVRGSREHGSGNDGCGGNGISENDGSCVG